ncbi:MAG: hypothetical protein GY786_07375 [Proteobacteria bacterium]|nr:hypothetical protein [Pseudomonadota bacterium]
MRVVILIPLVLLMVAISWVACFSTDKTAQEPEPVIKMPDFSEIRDIKKRKTTFFSYLIPLVQQENKKILQDRDKILKYRSKYSIFSINISELEKIARRYEYTMKGARKGAPIDELLERINVIPVDLVLAQAATESAWGGSRFATNNLNFFGEQCFYKGCGTIPLRRDKGMKHEVRKFNSVQESIHSYFHIINTKHAYKPFREIRAELVKNNLAISSDKLADGLFHYSERGWAYVKDIKTMIEYNAPLIKTLQ